MNAGILVPILVPLGLFALIFGIIYIRNRERMAMIERGMNPHIKPQSAPYQTLKWGLLFIGAGFGLFLANVLTRVLERTALAGGEDENVAIYFGLIFFFGGLGLFQSYRIEKKEVLDKE
ncbi:hypothetical protein IM792_08625 [Mucilaginibacter sp. JRF]|uniref:DUF6249 domain-containing protein n=1 Tax=Mucilaginibacter sp. JRF TaxID=2780088 RepID=UPI001881EA6E|nr:DUF6249 domain-containing protein [Mucilaginibacter sp. JRF]MBE9584508.1 hypothetical protein [Mucilaginibacter sp. JRF]